MKVGCILLAAGAGRRMGGVAKCLLQFNGSSLLERLLRQLWQLRCLRGTELHNLVLVLGQHAQEIHAHLTQLPQEMVPLCVINTRPDDGIASSLRTGLQALASDVDQVVVVLVDLPLLDAMDINAALDAFGARAPGIRVQIPWVHGEPGHPVIFDAHVLAELLSSIPPSLRQWRAAHPQAVCLWEVNNPHYTHDLDTPDDFNALVLGKH